MQVALFCHSLVSCWNHGNAHFLRGLVRELKARGHGVRVFEPRDAWSVKSLLADHGAAPIRRFLKAFPELRSQRYDLARFDLDRALDGVDLVLVHEWSDPDLVRRIGKHRAALRSYRLFFHDTHHRSKTRPEEMAAYDLRHYDGVLAFGEVIRDIYLKNAWAARAWTFHEAADTRWFYPREGEPERGQLVWVGNFGDEERTAELRKFLFYPAVSQGLTLRIHGVRYPTPVRRALAQAGILYEGWLPNHEVPRIFSAHRATVHVPRRPYAEALPGVPTIRPFEALATGTPLVSAPWHDDEGLFRAGVDHLVARDGHEMARHLRALVHDDDLARELAREGQKTIAERHTCAHRVDQLLSIVRELDGDA